MHTQQLSEVGVSGPRGFRESAYWTGAVSEFSKMLTIKKHKTPETETCSSCPNHILHPAGHGICKQKNNLLA